MNSRIRFGMTILGVSPKGGAFVCRKVASTAWAVFEISASDLLVLQRSESMPSLESATCVLMGHTKRQCMEQLEAELERQEALAIVNGFEQTKEKNQFSPS